MVFVLRSDIKNDDIENFRRISTQRDKMAKMTKLPKMTKIKETLRSVFFYKIDSPAGGGISSFSNFSSLMTLTQITW